VLTGPMPPLVGVPSNRWWSRSHPRV